MEIAVVGRFCIQHDLNPINMDIRQEMDDTYGTIDMKEDRAKTL